MMRTLRTIGIVGSAAALVLSATVVFARGQATSTPRGNAASGYRAMSASTTARMQTARDEAQARVQAQREKAAQRLADIQDKVKQQMAQHLAGQFDRINKTWTDHFLQLLDRYDAILQKIKDRSNIAAATGKDVTAATAAIEAAKAAIVSARIAVSAQAAKTYTLDTSTIPATVATTTRSGQGEIMQALRTSFRNLHNTLFKDLFALRDGPMTAARKAVQNALQTLGTIPGVDEGNATSTAEKSHQ